MAITTSLAGGQRTITLTYTADNAKVTQLLTDAARWMYDVKHKFNETDGDGAPIPWEDLTQLQRLNIIDYSVKAALLQWAKSYHYNAEILTAQEAIRAEEEEAYAL